MKASLLLLFILPMAASAQVAVRNEPYHHPVFENKYVRILDVHLPPGDTTAYHVHATPSVFITLREVKTGSEILSQDPADTATIGVNELEFTGFYHQPRIHRVWNSDTREYRVMDVELLNAKHVRIDPPLQEKGVRLVFDQLPARGYSLVLDPHSVVRINERKAPLLLVNTSETIPVDINNVVLKETGSYSFIQPQHTIVMRNNTNQKVTLAVVELK